MKKLLLSLLWLLPLSSAGATTDYFNGPTWYEYRNALLDIDGKGSLDNPIVVHTAADLAQIAWLVNEAGSTFISKVIVMAADIDLSKEVDGRRVSWIPIGLYTKRPFQGVFLGTTVTKAQRHTVKGMYIDLCSTTDYMGVGLFGNVAAFIGYVDLKQASIHLTGSSTHDIRLGLLAGSSLSESGSMQCREEAEGKTYPLSRGIYSVSTEGEIITNGKFSHISIGGIAGSSRASVCHSTSTLSLKANGLCRYVGGVAGSVQNYSGDSDTNTIIDCATEVDIKCTSGGIRDVGGIVGFIKDASVRGCTASGTIDTPYEADEEHNFLGTGGIAGMAGSGTRIEGCTSSVSMKALAWIGGILGTIENLPFRNPWIEGCFYSGHINATGADGAGGIMGDAKYNSGQFVNSCVFAGTMDYPANSTSCGAILGKTEKNVEENVACCYYDSQLFTGPGAGGTTKLTTIFGLSTADLTSGDMSKTPLLRINQEDYGFTLKESFYPAVVCMSRWEGYAMMTKNNFTTETLRKLLGSDMATVNNIGEPGRWFSKLPAVLKSFDSSTDFVSTLTFHNTSELWEDRTAGLSFNMIAIMLKPDDSFVTISGDELSARKAGTCTVTFQLRSKKKSSAVIRPDAPNAMRQLRLVSTVGSVWDGTIGTGCASGTGKAEDPYIIKNGNQLAYALLNNKEYEFYEQVCDITLFKNRHANPENPDNTHNLWISSSWPRRDILWKANYDGTGHFIKGAYIVRDDHGLFGNIEATGTVANLGIVDTHAPSYAGLFAGYMDGAITNCIAQGSAGNGIKDITSFSQKSFSGGFCSVVGLSNVEAYIEDCISAVTSGIYTFEDYTPFVSISANSKGTVRHCLAAVPFSHLDKNYKNNGITAAGKSYIQNCYWLKGYEEANTGQTLDEIAQMLGNRSLWQVTKGYLPMLSTFAGSDMGKLLSVPFRTDIGYEWDLANEESDSYLLGLGRQITFEPGSAAWSVVNDANGRFVEADSEMGVLVPMGGSYNEMNYSIYKKARRLPGLVFLTGSLGDASLPVPVRTRRGNFNAGLSFEDEHARSACLSALDSNGDGVLSLSEVRAVTNEGLLRALESPAAREVRRFREQRFFKGVTEQSGQLRGLSKLESVQLPYALRSIGKEAFKGCERLKEVTLPSRVVEVAGGAFYGSAIESIWVDPFNVSLVSRDGVLFTRDDELVAWPNGRVGREATVAGRVSGIGVGAFYKVAGLRELFLETTDYTTVAELSADGLLTDDGSLMDVYVSDGTYGGLLMGEYLDEESWQEYASAGKLHQYFPLKIGPEVKYYGEGMDASGKPTRTDTLGLEAGREVWGPQYLGTFYIGFATLLPAGLTPYVVSSTRAEEGKAYYAEKGRLVPALQPVMVMAVEPGTYRLTPVEGDVERWPAYGNCLIGVSRDGMRVNQSTSEQGSIMTLQMDLEQGVAAFVKENKNEIAPYHCYLPFPTIEDADWTRREKGRARTRYDLVAAKQVEDRVVYENDLVYAVTTLLPDGEKYATLLSYRGKERRVKLPGRLSDGTPVRRLGECVFRENGGSMVSIDMTEMDDLEAFDSNRGELTLPLGGLRGEAYVYLGGEKSPPWANTIVNDECVELRLYDGEDFWSPWDFHAGKVIYDRVLRATDKGGGEWESRAYTVCLPYGLDLTELCASGQVGVYTLHFADKNKELIFSNAVPWLEPGHAYVIVVHSGEITLNTADAMVACEPFVGWSVYDCEGGEVGIWRGTFSKIDSGEAAGMYAYSLQKDGYFKRIRGDTPQAWWSPFRSMFCASVGEGWDASVKPLGTNWFLPVFQKWVAGDDDDNPIVSFPSEGFEGDTDIEDDGSGVMHIIGDDGVHQYFDLKGRKLKSAPAKGIYIHNGKKQIAK